MLILCTLGIVMLASTSGVRAAEDYKDPHYFLKKQALWLLLGLFAASVMRFIDYRVWRRVLGPLAGVTLLLLVLVFVPPLGTRALGARRWVHFAGMSFQPSELAKLTVIVGMAWYLSRYQRLAATFWRGLAVPLAALGPFLLLILVEPDFGTTMLIGAVAMAIMFMGGVRLMYLIVSGVAGFVGLVYLIMQNPERLDRLLSFLHPEEHAQDGGFQLMQSLYAFIGGGALGRGLGQSMQKHHYLPEAHTDFILAIIGEELGVTATVSIVLLYLALFICGLRISTRAPDPFGRLTAFGLTLMLTMQAVINIGVVTGCMPTKGLALPFISFGGSSMLMSFVMAGILLNIASQAREEEVALPPSAPSAARMVRL